MESNVATMRVSVPGTRSEKNFLLKNVVFLGISFTFFLK